MAETGHARNVEHFSQIISFCQGYGGDYKPSNSAITVANLQAKLASSQAGIDGVTTSMAPWKTKVNERETAYEGIRKLVTRVVNSYAASGAQKNSVDDAKSFKRKIDGARAKALPKDDPDTPEDESKGNSVSQRSYTQVAEHFDNLIELLSNDPLYAPNETPLQIAQLQAKSTAMKNANDAVTAAATPLSNARITRNAELYAADTGLCDLAGLVKKYVKSLYGADSPQYKQISGLEFRTVK